MIEIADQLLGARAVFFDLAGFFGFVDFAARGAVVALVVALGEGGSALPEMIASSAASLPSTLLGDGALGAAATGSSLFTGALSGSASLLAGAGAGSGDSA